MSEKEVPTLAEIIARFRKFDMELHTTVASDEGLDREKKLEELSEKSTKLLEQLEDKLATIYLCIALIANDLKFDLKFPKEK